MKSFLSAVLCALFATALYAADPVFVTTTDSLADTLNEGDNYTDVVEATDADSADTITYAVLTGPSGLTVDPATGDIAWTPVQGDVGDNDIAITAMDLAGGTDTLSVTITVSNVDFAPVFTDADSMIDSVYEDSPLTDQAAAADADGDPIVFALVDGPADLVLDTTNGQLTWTPDNDDVGTHTIVITVTDTMGLSDTLTYSLTVVNVNDLPVIDTYGPVALDVYMTNNDSIEFTVTASDVDAGDSLMYSWLADMVEVGTGSSVKITAADTVVDVMVKVMDGTDTVSMAWTATFAAAFNDSMKPLLAAVRYLTAATPGMDDDILQIELTEDIADDQLPGTFDDIFTVIGASVFSNGTVSTGDVANDNIIEIAMNAADTMPAQYADMLALKDGVLFSTALVPCAADTADIDVYLVKNVGTGTEYAHVQTALDDAGTGDTLLVNGGYYEGVFNFEPHNDLLLQAVDGTDPVLAYNGDSVLTTSAWLGGVCFIKFNKSTTSIPTIDGFTISGTSSEDSVISQSMQGAFNLYNCTFTGINNSHLNHRLGNAPSGVSAVIENCDFSGGYTCLVLYLPNTVFRNNYIHDVTNDAGWQGPNGLYISGGSKTIENNYFENCGNQTGSGRQGGAIWLRGDANNVFRNNIIYDCAKAVSFYSDSKSETFINNTIADCYGTAIGYSGGKECYFINNIIVGSGGTDLNVSNADGAQFYQNNLLGTVSAVIEPVLTGPGAVGNLIGADPMFVANDSSGVDLHLGVFSPALDAGYGNFRDADGYPSDMGAYGGEYAYDGLQPGVVGGFSVTASATDSMDTLTWDDEGGAVNMYAVYRADAAEGAAFVPDSNNMVASTESTFAVLPNLGGKWYYKINMVDTSGYAGGYVMAANSSGPEVLPGGTELNFGTLELGEAETLIMSVSNVGTDTLHITGFGLALGDQFTVDTSFTKVIRPNRTSLIFVEYMPDTLGSHADTMFITTDDPDSSDMTLAVLLYGNVAQAAISHSPDPVDFDTVQVDSVSGRKYFYIDNDGNGDLVIDSMTFGDTLFYFTDNLTFPLTVSPLGTRRLSSYFAPVANGAVTDTLTIYSNDPVTPAYQVVFNGEGVGGDTSSIADVGAVTEQPAHMTVSPNPTAGQLGVAFTLKAARLVTVDLHDARGSHVMQLAKGLYPAGTSRIAWDGQLAQGTYFVTVSGNGIYQTSKVTVRQ